MVKHDKRLTHQEEDSELMKWDPYSPVAKADSSSGIPEETQT